MHPGLYRALAALWLALALVASAFALQAQDAPPSARLYLLSGQSNMQGRGVVAHLADGQRQAPADVWFWNGEHFEPLVPGTTKLGARAADFGPELGFVAGLRDAGETGAIYLAKFFRSGQGLHAGIDGDQWRGAEPGPGRATFYPGIEPGDANVGKHYVAWWAQVAAARAAFVAREPAGKLAGVVWMQGEQDAKHEVAAREYASSLRLLRRRLGEDLGVADLPWVFGQVLPFEPTPARFGHRDALRRRMADLDERAQTGDAEPGMRMVPTEPCRLLADHVHYDTAGQWQLGQAFARELLAMRGAPKGPAWVDLRGGLDRSHAALARGVARVAFLGGSITHNPGWREQVGQWLTERYPATKFTFVNAGIPSMGSTPGAFRLARDVLAAPAFGGERIDLLFVEAAVNDSTNVRMGFEQVRAMEGIVRAARLHSPDVDVVFLHFADPDKVAAYDRGTVPDVIQNHERVAAHYGVPSLDLAREVRDRIARGEFTWAAGMRDLHPSPFGQQLYAAGVQRLLEAGWLVARTSTEATPPRSLPAPLDPACYDAGRLLPPDAAEVAAGGFELVAKASFAPGAGTRPGFVDVPMLVGDKPGQSFALAFEGRAVGIFVAAGPDAGSIEFRIDDGSWQRQDLFTRWSKALHLPWLYVLDADLPAGPHRLEVRIAADRHPAFGGYACRIVHFAVNGPAPQLSR